MRVLAHTLNLYQKPQAGNGFLNRFTVHNYKHRISAVGWFDTASCDIVPRSNAAPQIFVDQFLGNRVAVYVDNPAEPIWEGFINRLTFNLGAAQFTISLDEMMNAVTVKAAVAGGNIGSYAATSTTKALASQAVYGIKTGMVDIGYLKTTTSNKQATIGSTKLQQLAWPKQSIVPGQGQPSVIHLEMLGFYHTMKWQECRIGSTANDTLTNMFTNVTYGVLPNLVNGALFFDNTDYSEIASNTLTMPVNEISGKTYWDRVVDVQEIGDAGFNYYLVGVTPTNLQTGKRRLFYRAANTTIEYTSLTSDGLLIRDTSRRLYPAWRVKPDRGVRVADWLIGAISGDDPREMYIKTIDYDANTQRVVVSGDDSLTAEAAFQLHQNTPRMGKRFGAKPYPFNTTT